jgi:sulfide:quinone oxidoreductase
VYVGAFETPAACQKWQDEFGLKFPVIPDVDGELFVKLTTGWVPCSILVGPDGKVLFWETEFDEAGFTAAISKLYSEQAEAPPESAPAKRPARRAVPSTGATVVILGGGAGGIVAAHDLRRKLASKHRIVVIDRSSEHLFASSLLWLAVGQRNDDQIRRPLDRLADKGIEFCHGEVEEVDLDRRQVRTASERFEFDWLVVSLGARLAPETVEGFDEMALNLYDLEGCKKIHAALETFAGGTLGVLVTSFPFKCPAAPYEAALLAEAFLRKTGVRDKTEIHLFTPEHQPMPMAGPEFGDAIVNMLRARGIDLHLLYTFDRLLPETREILSSDGHKQKVDLLIGVPPHVAPEVIRSSGLIGVSGWIHVDQNTLRTEHDGVFAIGDVANIRLPNGKTLPMAGAFAHYQVKVVAERIAAELSGHEPRASFDGRGSPSNSGGCTAGSDPSRRLAHGQTTPDPGIRPRRAPKTRDRPRAPP